MSLTQTPRDFAENCFGSLLSLSPHTGRVLLLFSVTPHRAPTAAQRGPESGGREHREGAEEHLLPLRSWPWRHNSILGPSKTSDYKIRALDRTLSPLHAHSLLTPPWQQLEARRTPPPSFPALLESVIEFT